MRKTIPLMDGWTFQKPGTAVEAITLPHTWNSIDGQDGGNDYWRGTAIYAKRFVSPALGEGERCFIEFKGAAMTAEVILNGVPVVRHEGGYSTFRADITDHLAPENRLTVTLSNAANDRVYPQMADFTFYGGLYREVALVIVPAEHFELTRDGTPGIKVTPVVDPGRNRAVVTVETWQNASSVTLTVNGESKTVPSSEGHATADFTIENVRLWNGVKGL